MSFTVSDFEDFLRILDQYPEWQRELRNRLIGGDFARIERAIADLTSIVRDLAANGQRLEQQVRELVAAQQQTEQRVEALAEAQRRTEEQVALLIETQRRFELRLERVELRLDSVDQHLESIDRHLEVSDQRLHRLEVNSAEMRGDFLEQRYQRHAAGYFGRLLRRIRVIPIAELEDQLEAALSDEELEDLQVLDLLVRGRRKRGANTDSTWLAIEISAALDMGDVDRAKRRAALLRKAGIPAVAVIAGELGDSFTEPNALRQRVAVVTNGRIAGWDEALAVLSEPA